MNVTTNVNSSPITLYLPDYLKNGVDEIVRFKRISRTSLINGLLSNWIKDEIKNLKEVEEFSDLIENVRLKSQTKKSKTDVEESTNKWSVKSRNTWEDSY